MWWLCPAGRAGRGAPLPSWGQATAGGLAPGPALLDSVRQALESALKVGPGPLGDPRLREVRGQKAAGRQGPERRRGRQTDRRGRMASDTQR